MTNVNPQVFLIASTQESQSGMQRWLDSLGAEEYMEPLQGQHPGERLIEAAGRRCYMSFKPGLNPNVTKVRTDSADYFRNIMESGHGSVLRHTTASFAIEFVSRVFTAEINRHSAGVAISEGSMRYIRLTNMQTWDPWGPDIDDAPNAVQAAKFAAASLEHTAAFEEAEARQRRLEALFADELASGDFRIKKILTSRFRRTCPLGIATGGIWTFNLQALRHVLQLRSTPAVEEEMVPVMQQMGEIARINWPNVFQDFRWVEADAHVQPGRHDGEPVRGQAGWECEWKKV
jgi:thymidylate synthase (FAD)